MFAQILTLIYNHDITAFLIRGHPCHPVRHEACVYI
jgi:hypothetical protein